MNIKKFIGCTGFNDNYNDLIQKELKAISNGVTTEYECVYKIFDYDFFELKYEITDIINDPNIKEFSELFKNPKYLCYHGPMIKRYINPIKTSLPIQNYYIVNIIDTYSNINDMLIDSKLLEGIELNNNVYTFKTSNSVFYLHKKSNLILSNTLLKIENPLDRVVLSNNELWVSGMFILELYKKLSCYNPEIVDPIFKYPEDILNIYDKKQTDNQNIKYLIDIADVESVKLYDKNIIESTFIQYNNQMYNILEYVLIRIMSVSHPVINYHLKSIINHISNYRYNRPIFFVAKLIGFNKKYPAIYDSLIEIPHSIDIKHTIDTSSLESVYHIDMYILNHFIKNDNESMFIKYISKMNIKNKFKNISKTSTKICSWIIEYKAFRITNSLIDLDLICDSLKYKIIFMTGEFNLLGREFIDRYLDNNSDKKNDRVKIIKKEDIRDNTTEDSNDNITDNVIDSNLREIILANLPDVIKQGLTRSFYIILKLCPDILQSNFCDDGNILHIINSDISIDILEIILKINPELKNQQNKDGYTPINIYAIHGSTKSINMLLSYDVDYTITDNNNNTILHTLAIYGQYNTFQCIVRNVIDIINTKNNNQMTPLMIAAKHGCEEIIYILKGLDADMNIKDIYDNTVYHYICSSCICLGMIIPNNPNKFGFTPQNYCRISHSFYHFQ